MKKFILTSAILLLTLLSVPGFTFATDPENVPAATTSEARSAQLVSRLHEIKDMDKQSLSRTEKKELRREVKDIRKELKAGSNGIYLSVGAIIIILLVLILIL